MNTLEQQFHFMAHHPGKSHFPAVAQSIVLMSSIICVIHLSGCVMVETNSAAEQSTAVPAVPHSMMLNSKMQEMATNISKMVAITLDDSLSLEAQSATVIPILDDIEGIASDVHDEEQTSYSVINQYMGAFLYDVGIARKFAQRTPPNLVPAQRLINSCLSCHESI